LHAVWRPKILYDRKNLSDWAVNIRKKLHFCSIGFEPGKLIEYPSHTKLINEPTREVVETRRRSKSRNGPMWIQNFTARAFEKLRREELDAVIRGDKTLEEALDRIQAEGQALTDRIPEKNP
ncbi:hypothetical protein, partial [Paenibacillus cisolokensis]